MRQAKAENTTKLREKMELAVERPIGGARRDRWRR
jgi:hypothetical protein